MREFNSAGPCVPTKHYMVDTSDRVAQMRALVDQGEYLCLNLPPQHGSTTMLWELSQSLRESYTVANLLLCGMSEATYRSESSFVSALARRLLDEVSYGELSMKSHIGQSMRTLAENDSDSADLSGLFALLRAWINDNELPIVLILDELYHAPSKQVFLDFLAQLRTEYLHHKENPSYPAFQSVVLEGVRDARFLGAGGQLEGHTDPGGPWETVAAFGVDMSFSVADVAGMLAEYESDHATSMDVGAVADEIITWTGGYPYLVSRICQLMDKRGLTWDNKGIIHVVSSLRNERMCIIEPLMSLLEHYPKLKDLLKGTIMRGEEIDYSPYDKAQRALMTYGFAKRQGGRLIVANRFFESLLLDLLLHEDAIAGDPFYRAGCLYRDRCVVDD